MFLDEISEMGAPLQSKLLQVLQDGEFARLGGRQDVKVDVRVVAATNRDLEGAVADGQFREDLFFRLNVVCITLPPLRQRRDEIRAAHRSSSSRTTPSTTTSRRSRWRTDTLRLFAEYDWPGNVRELENLVKRMVILGTDTAIRREVADAIAGRTPQVGPIPVDRAGRGAPPARPRRRRQRRAAVAGSRRPRPAGAARSKTSAVRPRAKPNAN